jgi:hypothetical protein
MATDRLDAVEAALNAVIGDYLARRRNALAIDMTLFHEGAPVVTTGDAGRAAGGRERGTVVVLVHGLGTTEACWSFVDDPLQTYGTLLRDDFGLIPLYVRYNTGRRILENGKDLALRLEELVVRSLDPARATRFLPRFAPPRRTARKGGLRDFRHPRRD